MNDDKKVSFFEQYKMIILCLIPIAVALFLFSTGVISSGIWLFLIICPLMHILMMMGMRGKEH